MRKILLLIFCFLCNTCVLYGCSSDKVNSSSKNSQLERFAQSEDLVSFINHSTLLYPAANDEYEYNVYEEFVEITKYLGEDTQISIPNEIENLPVYVIGGINADYTSDDRGKTAHENERTTHVIIPDNVVIIKEGAFHAFTELKTVQLGSSVQIIEDYAFEGCNNLETIEFPDSLRILGDYAFAWSGNYVDDFDVILNEGLQEIGLRAFYDGEIDEITIPQSVITIGEKAFTGIEKETEGWGNEHVLVVKGYKGSAAAQYVVESQEYIDDANKYDEFKFKFESID